MIYWEEKELLRLNKTLFFFFSFDFCKIFRCSSQTKRDQDLNFTYLWIYNFFFFFEKQIVLQNFVPDLVKLRLKFCSDSSLVKSVGPSCNIQTLFLQWSLVKSKHYNISNKFITKAQWCCLIICCSITIVNSFFDSISC